MESKSKYNKQIFAKNLKRYMDMHGKSRKDMCAALGISYYTFTDWVNGKKFPRIDKIETLADFFNIEKSDLIEKQLTDETKKDNDTLSDIIVRMRLDKDFFSVVESLNQLDTEKLAGVKQMLNAFLK